MKGIVRVNFKKPGAGIYSLFLKWGEKLQFGYGRARRIPKDDESVFNTIPIKFITSVEVTEQPKDNNKGGHIMDYIDFTAEKLVSFRELYKNTDDGKSFIFEGKEVLKEYAYHIIKYLEIKIKNDGVK